jgi:hypothetical protein
VDLTYALLLLSAALVGAGRFTFKGHGLSWMGSYEAFAHMWVGAMMVVVYYEWRTTFGWTALALLIVLTVLETAAFAYGVQRGWFPVWKGQEGRHGVQDL